MSHPENQYLNLLHRLRYAPNVAVRGDRTGTGTRGIFGAQMRFDLAQGFPLLTTKKVFWKGVVAELLWMLRGETNIKPLIDQGVHIWDAWADANGELGPVYGAQWRKWTVNHEYGITVDQIMDAQRLIKTDPNSRRIVVSSWNVGDLEDMALSPCHCLFQFFVADGKLSCHLYQRSADVFLGVPFNIASYALLTHLMAAACDLKVGDFVHTFGDLHLYSNHMDAAAEQLARQPVPFPKLGLQNLGRVIENVWDWQAENIVLHDYNPHPAIKAPVAV